MAAAVKLTKTSGKVGKERALIDPGQTLTGYDVSPDGRRFVLRLRRGSCLPARDRGENWDSVLTR